MAWTLLLPACFCLDWQVCLLLLPPGKCACYYCHLAGVPATAATNLPLPAPPPSPASHLPCASALQVLLPPDQLTGLQVEECVATSHYLLLASRSCSNGSLAYTVLGPLKSDDDLAGSMMTGT